MELAKPPSLFHFETMIPPVNDEAFNLYYSLDRELYTRLIHNLARDPVDSMHVIALWIWLEKKWRNMNLINEILSLPLEVLNVLADESMMCLRCIESNTCPPADQVEITLIQEVVNRGPMLSLRYFHENRDEVSAGVTKFITTVCVRAFKDILQDHHMRQQMTNNSALMSGGRYESGGVPSNAEEMMRNSMNIINNNNTYNQMINTGDDVHYYNPAGGVVNVPMMYPPDNYQGMVQPPFVPVVPPPEGRAVTALEDLPIEAFGDLLPTSFVQMMLADDLSEVFGNNLTLNNNWEQGENSNAGEGDGGDEEEVAPDDRTIFLTFSKGYPTTRDEVHEFFTRKFGNFIEELIMQEVEADEQALYARMVCRSSSVIPSIVGPNKAKFNINGKHVWARKYVKKQNSRV